MKRKRLITLVILMASMTMIACQSGSGDKSASQLTVDLDEKGTLTEGTGGSSFVDLSVRDGMPLFKRQSYFVSGLGHFYRDTPKLLELRARTARFSLPLKGGTDEKELNYYLKTMMDDVGKILRKYSTPLWHVAYVEGAATEEAMVQYPNNYNFCEPDYEIFNPAWTTAAKYMADQNMRSLYEIWNEPDQVGFMTNFDWDGYIRLYNNAASAIRGGDSEAFVGGPAMSDMGLVGYNNYKKFIDSVNGEGNALDFVSAHYYDNSPTHSLTDLLNDLRQGLDEEQNASTQIILTEFNVHTPPQSEWECAVEDRTDFTLQKAAVVPKALKTIATLNSYNDVTQVQWALLSYVNGSLDLIDPDGNRTPLYHALNLYAHMPVESVKTEIADGCEVSAMASSDEDLTGIFCWNNSETEAQQMSLQIDNITYDSYTVKVYRIDSEHSSYYETGEGDELTLVTCLEGATSDSLTWEGEIPVGGTVYIAIETGRESKLEQHESVGTIIRSDYYYEDRYQNSYSDFDELTSTAILGTGDNEEARGLSYVTYADIAETLSVEYNLLNAPAAEGENSYLALRVDYHTDAGYVSSVAYELVNGGGERLIPYGTGRKAEKVIPVTVEGTTGNFTVDLAANAPEEWDGKVILSFDMEDTGKQTEASFRLGEGF